MKKLLWVFLLPVFMFSCKKEDTCPEITTTAPAAEVTALKTYLSGGGIAATEDPRGFFYTITTQGTGKKPNACSPVSVDYVGKLTNGTQFDANNNISFSLSQLILGWRLGIPLLNEGGSITLYLPPTFGYGASTAGSIPPNSILIFTVKLNAVF
jgi:FKBP-type peptidyl-prolyl cis-trans isomerase FkpA